MGGLSPRSFASKTWFGSNAPLTLLRKTSCWQRAKSKVGVPIMWNGLQLPFRSVNLYWLLGAEDSQDSERKALQMKLLDSTDCGCHTRRALSVPLPNSCQLLHEVTDTQSLLWSFWASAAWINLHSLALQTISLSTLCSQRVNNQQFYVLLCLKRFTMFCAYRLSFVLSVES